MYGLNRRGLLLRYLVAALSGLLIAASPAAGWQFRDVTSPVQPSLRQGAPAAADQQPDGPSTPSGVEPDAQTPAASSVPESQSESVTKATPQSGSESGADAEAAIEVRPIRFNEASAGVTTAEQLKQRWGQPLKVTNDGKKTVWKYKVPPFPQVDVTIVDDTVSSMLIFMGQPLGPANVVKEMGLDTIRPVPIPDAVGRVLGQAYPERGVLLSFTEDLDAMQVERVQLEPISAELFLLRVEYDFQRQYKRDLADIENALKLDPDYAQAYWWRAKILRQVGQFRSALEASETAVQLNPSSAAFRVTLGRLQWLNGKRSEALKQVQQLMAEPDVPAQLQARAELLMGDLLASSPKRQYKEAMKHHLESIRIAAPLVDESRFAVRRAAKRVLIDAHLATALDIAKGDFRGKKEVVPKWIDRSKALIDEYVLREQGDRAIRLQALRAQLAASAELDGAIDPELPTEEAIELGRELIAADPDPLNQSRIQWELGHTLFESMRVARLQQKPQEALARANNAIVLFEQSAPKRQSTPQQKYLIGRLYFLVGTIHAVQLQDHHEAVAWYDKAESLLRDTLPALAQADAGIFGERFVSMGVSHWETGDHEKALELTEYGLTNIQLAVKAGRLKADALAVPYGNLAAMHEQAGHTAEAKKFAALAAKLDATRVR